MPGDGCFVALILGDHPHHGCVVALMDSMHDCIVELMLRDGYIVTDEFRDWLCCSTYGLSDRFVSFFTLIHSCFFITFPVSRNLFKRYCIVNRAVDLRWRRLGAHLWQCQGPDLQDVRVRCGKEDQGQGYTMLALTRLHV